MARWVGTVALGFVAAGGCATLPDIDSDVCGNGVVETHEDCDTFPPAGAKGITCGQPGTKAACLMQASQASDCPSGFVFGPVDRLCRKPTNGFHAGPDFNDITGRAATVADFDGDGIGDLTLTPDDEATREIDYMAGDAVRTKLTLSANALLVDAIGSIDGDARADLVVPTVSGITALHGAEKGGFEPQIFSVFESPPLKVFDVPDAFIGIGDGERTPAGIGREDPSSCQDDASCTLFLCFGACAP